jgi:hypothetical protein
LRTELAALVVGYREAGRIVQRLPPHPPRLHGFVHRCDPAELRDFGQRLDFLTTLLAASGTTDELIAATLRQLAAVRGDEREYLVAAGKRLALLLGGDVQRLGAILRAAQA